MEPDDRSASESGDQTLLGAAARDRHNLAEDADREPPGARARRLRVADQLCHHPAARRLRADLARYGGLEGVRGLRELRRGALAERSESAPRFRCATGFSAGSAAGQLDLV